MGAPAREHPLARGKLADRANEFLGRAWDKGWLPRPTLDPDELWTIAAKPFGSRAKQAETDGRSSGAAIDFRLRLEKLSASVREEANLNPLGQAMAHGQLTRVIANRLKLSEHFVRIQDPRGFELAPPIIVVGHMRSGTTRIHKLLAADPAHSHTRYCESYHPVPSLPGVRRAKSMMELGMLGALNPWLQVIHPMASGEVEEELGWLAAALQHSIYESQWRIPSYSAWSEARDAKWIYSEFAKILRTDASFRANAHKPRVMKVPTFSENLGDLLFEFPEARLILAERDHAAVLRSAVSLAANQMAVQSDSCDLDEIEAFWRHKIALRENRMAAALADWKGPVVRLSFDALNEDWEGEIRRTYSELGLTLSPQALAAMHKSISGSANGHHRAHSAHLDRFAAES